MTTSRIYLVDLSQQGWIWHLTAARPGAENGGLGPAVFPYNGTNPLTVTLYTITPDNVNDTTVYLKPPLVTADAVRFTPVSAQPGSLLSPVVSGKLSAVALNTPGNPDPRYFYVARQENTLDTATTRNDLKSDAALDRNRRNQPVVSLTRRPPSPRPSSTASTIRRLKTS